MVYLSSVTGQISRDGKVRGPDGNLASGRAAQRRGLGASAPFCLVQLHIL